MIQLTEPVFGDEELEAVEEVFASGWLAEGTRTEQFEHNICKFVGSGYAVAVSNATVGLELCLRALEIRGRVAVPAFGHPATVRAILNAGCTPVFVDVSLETYNVNFETVSFPNSTHLPVVPVAWGGRPLNHSAYVNEVVCDGACALGSGEGSIYTTVFSFHPRKLISTGEGGIVTTNSREMAETIRDLKNFGWTNAKFDDIRAAIGIEQLKRLPDIIEQRRVMAKTYDDLLSDCSYIVAPELVEGHTFQTYAVYLKKGNRDKVIEELRKRGIETQIGAYYLSDLDSWGSYKNSYWLSLHLLALPMSASMTFEQQKTVIEELKKAIN